MDDFNNDIHQKITRSGFLKTISGFFSGFIALFLGVPLIDSLVESKKRRKSKTYSKLVSMDSVDPGQPVNLPIVMTVEDAFIKKNQAENVWVVKNTNSETTVFSPICPHLGCRYQWHSDSKLFICPCHNSVFTIDGKVVSGPSPRSLDTLPTKVENNYLYVLWERFKPGIETKEELS